MYTVFEVPWQRHATTPVSITIGIVAGLIVTVTITAAGGLSLLSHLECKRGEPVSTILLWTPFDLANSPYLGSTSYSAAFQVYEPFGLTVVTDTNSLRNGNVSAGYFQTENWTIFSQSNSSEVGPGFDTACDSPYDVEPAPTNFSSSFGGYVLQGPGNTSNVNEPTAFPIAPPQRPPAVFSNGFTTANRPSVSTCGTHSKEVNFASKSFGISITFLGRYGPVTTHATVPSDQNFTYYFPANAGTWLVDDLQLNSGLQGPGLAFSWQPC
jgi:hypothetical protein